MTIYTKAKIEKLYRASFKSAINKLKEIPIFCGNEPNFTGLGGWVFEQTIQYCLKRELKARKIKIDIAEQVNLKPRVKADLKIGNVVIEIKQSGLFDRSAIAKYAIYKQAANLLGMEYVFITLGERYEPYRIGIIKEIGDENSFFLDTDGDWARFVDRVTQLVK